MMVETTLDIQSYLLFGKVVFLKFTVFPVIPVFYDYRFFPFLRSFYAPVPESKRSGAGDRF